MKKLATPFIKLWNWIKETAWIQPVLIVGLVFAVIFSISPLVNWINGLNTTEAETNSYYARFQYSLEGILSANKDDKSSAGKLIQDIQTATGMSDGAEKDRFISEKLPGKKFFLAFVQKQCEACQTAKEGIETLEQNWNRDYYIPTDGLSFKMASIFTDQEVTNNTDETTLAAFDQFLNNYSNFFETSTSNILNTPYYEQGNIDETKLGYFQDADTDNFQTPTLLLIDFTSTGLNGTSELMFSVPGEGGDSGKYGKARTLINCWNGLGDFEYKK